MSLLAEKVGPIERVESIVVSLPLVRPFETSFGVKREKTALLLKISSEGLVGWGECIASPDPYYSYETIQTARHLIKDFLLPLLGNSPSIGELLDSFRRVRGHPMAKAAVENALLDLIARRRGVPLHALFGAEKRRIPAGVSFGIQKDTAGLLELVAWAVGKKFHKIKVKIKKGKDLEILEAVRSRFPHINLMADANADYSLDDLPLFREMDHYRLLMIEQPLSYDDLYHHALLQRELATPICLDESVTSFDSAATAIAMGSCRIINIKQGRVGGLIESSRIAEYSLERGIGVWSGSVIETGIGRTFNMHLQTLPGFVFAGDNSGTVRAFEEDITEPMPVLGDDGCVEIPEGAGIGVRVLEERVARYCIFREESYRGMR
ncbi:MAG: o-succinylbenzoate synthase [Geobacteraceae bacterium]|nr:o-succinylbenzoate synthase [Geobacteraceae bacterium]